MDAVSKIFLMQSYTPTGLRGSGFHYEFGLFLSNSPVKYKPHFLPAQQCLPGAAVDWCIYLAPRFPGSVYIIDRHGYKQAASTGQSFKCCYYCSCLEITNTLPSGCVAAEQVFPARSSTQSVSQLLLPPNKALQLLQPCPRGKSSLLWHLGDLPFVWKLIIWMCLSLSHSVISF